MDKKTTEMYLHLMLSFAIIPATLYNWALVKALFLVYAVFLTLKKDAYYLPALCVIASFFLSSYLIYLSITFLSIKNYRKIKSYGLAYLLNILLAFLPIAIIVTVLKITSNNPIGPSITHFQLYFSFFSFFFGMLIYESFDRKVMKALMLALIVLLFSSVILKNNENFYLFRLFFYIVPLFISLIAFLIFTKQRRNLFLYFFLSILVIYQAFILTGGGTFTLIISTLFTILISTLYYVKRNKTLLRITGIGAFVVVISLQVFGMFRHADYDYSGFRGLQMEDVDSFDTFSDRLLMKFFEDRSTIWNSSFQQTIKNKHWLPPLEVDKILLIPRYGSEIEYDHHSHNIFLEMLRLFGIIMGGALSAILIYMVLLGRKIFEIKNIDPFFILLLSVSVSTIIIGGVTGIFILLQSYAILGVTLLGVSYAYYKVHEISQQKKPIK